MNRGALASTATTVYRPGMLAASADLAIHESYQMKRVDLWQVVFASNNK